VKNEEFAKWKACLKEITAYYDNLEPKQLKPPAVSLWDWLKQPPRNLTTKTEFFRLSDEERKRLIDEYLRLCQESEER